MWTVDERGKVLSRISITPPPDVGPQGRECGSAWESSRSRLRLWYSCESSGMPDGFPHFLHTAAEVCTVLHHVDHALE